MPSGASSSSSSSGAEPFVVTVRFTRACDAFRALGHVLGVTRSCLSPVTPQTDIARLHPGLVSVSTASKANANGHVADGGPAATVADQQWYIDAERIVRESLSAYSEASCFETLGTMIDCSRNGVLKGSSVKFLLRKFALMGYNMLCVASSVTSTDVR